MNAAAALKHIAKTRIIAILRGELGGQEVDLAEALAEGGVTAIEVSTVCPGFSEAIRRIAQKPGNRIAVGAGTVLTMTELHAVVDVGASFIVSPNLNAEVVRETRRLGLASFPGAYTATEIVQAIDAGADAVKIFPAVSLGPGYVRAIRGPLPGARLVPTGGVDLGNITAWLEAGSYAVGIGSELLGKEDLAAREHGGLREKAFAFASAAREAVRLP